VQSSIKLNRNRHEKGEGITKKGKKKRATKDAGKKPTNKNTNPPIPGGSSQNSDAEEKKAKMTRKWGKGEGGGGESEKSPKKPNKK